MGSRQADLGAIEQCTDMIGFSTLLYCPCRRIQAGCMAVQTILNTILHLSLYVLLLGILTHLSSPSVSMETSMFMLISPGTRYLLHGMYPACAMWLQRVHVSPEGFVTLIWILYRSADLILRRLRGIRFAGEQMVQ